MMKWERLQHQNHGSPAANRGSHPGKRWGHTCNAIKGGCFLYVFGGYGEDDCQTNHVHVFDTVKKTWFQPDVKGAAPSPRDSHSCTAVGDNLYVFGGTDGANVLGDLHILDTCSHTWILPNIRGDGPAPREGHSSTLVGKRIFIFGGSGKSPQSCKKMYFNDLHLLNTETFTWKHAVTSGALPPPRESHSCTTHDNKMIVVGGEDSNDYYLSDVYVLDTDTLIWKEIITSGHVLPPRAGHSTVSISNKLIIFGGFTDGRTLNCDLHVLDIETASWTKVAATGEGPSSRFCMAGDTIVPSPPPPLTAVIMFIGGCSQRLEPLDDIYYLHTDIVARRTEKIGIQRLHSFLPAAYGGGIDVQQHGRKKRTFRARVTQCFPHGYTIETFIDGRPLRGVLFSTRPVASPPLPPALLQNGAVADPPAQLSLSADLASTTLELSLSQHCTTVEECPARPTRSV